jgi:hypothetical protein
MRNRQLGYARIRKARWHLLPADIFGAMVSELAWEETEAHKLAIRGRIHRRRMDAVTTFRKVHGSLKETWWFVPAKIPARRMSGYFRSKPMWHKRRS